MSGNRRLDKDFERLDGRDRADLAAARADLRDIAATERLFDRRLLGIALAGRPGVTARELVRVNEARAVLTELAARSPSLGELRTYEPRLTAENAPVEREVAAIRRELGLPVDEGPLPVRLAAE